LSEKPHPLPHHPETSAVKGAWERSTRADVVEFLDDLEREEGLRHSSQPLAGKTLRAIFAYAIEKRELVTVNPVVGVSKRKCRNSSRRPHIDRPRV